MDKNRLVLMFHLGRSRSGLRAPRWWPRAQAVPECVTDSLCWAVGVACPGERRGRKLGLKKFHQSFFFFSMIDTLLTNVTSSREPNSNPYAMRILVMG